MSRRGLNARLTVDGYERNGWQGNREATLSRSRHLAARLAVSLTGMIIALACIGAAVSQAEPMPNGVPGTWALRLNEEFTSAGLNATLWTPGWQHGGISGPMSGQCLSSGNVEQPGNGYLYLWTKKASNTCDGTNVEYTGGLVESNPGDGVEGHAGFQYSYGYVEWSTFVTGTEQNCTSKCLPDWPALWSFPGNNEENEIDIMEGLHGSVCHTWWHHIAPIEEIQGCQSGNYAGWHTYGVDWEPGVLKFYYDGAKVGEVSSGYINSTPQYLIANMVPPGAHGGALVAPAALTIDYVRVWQHPVAPSATTNAASSVQPLQATLNGTVNPQGWDTHYYFKYGKAAANEMSTSSGDAGSGQGSTGESATVTSLEPGTTYHYRIIATSAGGTVEGKEEAFKTPGPVEAVTTAGTGVAAERATLNGTINPRGYDAKYYFQYGPNTTYGQLSAEGDAGAGTNPVPESATLTKLAAGTIYHYRLVGTSGGVTSYGADHKFTTQDEPSSSRWVDSNLDTDETSVYFRNSSGAVAWWQRLAGIGWEKGVLGVSGAMATGTTPAVLYSPSTGETSVYYQTSGHELAYWQWLPGGIGWGTRVLGGHMAPGTNPAALYSPASGETTVYYQNSSDELAFAQWKPVEGWANGVVGGHMAAGTTPAVVANPATGIPTVYYQNSSNEIAYFEWQAGKGWVPGPVGGHVAAGTSPTVVVNWSTPETTVYYQNSAGELAFSQWQTGKGWQSGVIGGHVAVGTTPAVVVNWSTPETTIYYQNSSNEIAFWQWRPGVGWEKGNGTLGGKAAAGTSPTVLVNWSTPETTVYFENSGGEIAFWQWQVGIGWGKGVV
jgi:Fungal fucose-specific lectin/Glycosyl hydrolases family 16